jgi:F0F1-type ATP synthase membrane subunit b/b'
MTKNNFKFIKSKLTMILFILLTLIFISFIISKNTTKVTDSKIKEIKDSTAPNKQLRIEIGEPIN